MPCIGYSPACAFAVNLNGEYHDLQLVLLTLANNCELQPARDPTLQIQAAEYRQQLFVEMIHQGEPITEKCAVCQKDLSAHKPSLPEPMESRIVVSQCLHLFHKACLQSLDAELICPICSQLVANRQVETCNGTGPERVG